MMSLAIRLSLPVRSAAWVQQLPNNVIMTPHPREFDRITGRRNCSDYERLMLARDMARDLCAYIILKGHYSALCLPDGGILFNTTGNSGMATAGSGDVLTSLSAAAATSVRAPSFLLCQVPDRCQRLEIRRCR